MHPVLHDVCGRCRLPGRQQSRWEHVPVEACWARIDPQERVPVNLFHKRAWEKLVVAADYPYFKWIETGAMQWLQTQTQAPPFRWYE